PNAYIVVAITASIKALTANKNGETKIYVNSSGSVIPAIIAVKVAGTSRPATVFLFDFFAVTYMAKAAAGKPKMFELPCIAKPPSGNNSISGRVDWLNA